MKGKELKLVIRKPISIREKVYKVIRNDILESRIPPGARMIETQLAKQINTSRTPVREALHMLEMEGLLEAIPRVGYRVKQIDWNELVEITEIRTVNEILAARWAMKRITPEDILALEKNLLVAETEIRQGNPRSFVERDAEFHEILVRASGSKRLLELCQLLRRHMLRYRIEALYLPETGLRAIGEHRRILECMRAMDEKGVETAIREHLEQAKREIQRHAFGKDTRSKDRSA
jgi:DNA-binding GntR family transcriptional regulator